MSRRPGGDGYDARYRKEVLNGVQTWDVLCGVDFRTGDMLVRVGAAGSFWPDSQGHLRNEHGYKNGTFSTNGNGEVAVVNAQPGAKPSAVCQGRVGWRPDWSPQGKKLLFRLQEGAMEQLQIMDLEADGKPMSVPKQFGRRNSDATWSPDGKQIVFSSDRG